MRSFNRVLVAAGMLCASAAALADANYFDPSPWNTAVPDTIKTYPYKPSEYARIGTIADALKVYAAGDDRELLAAAARNDTAAVELLLKAGANPNAKDEGNVRPLMFAMDFGAIEIARLLLDAGADPNVKKDGAPLLAIAAMNGYTRVAGLLLQAGARLDERSASNDTALINAVLMNHADTVRMLLHYGPDLSLENDAGKTALAIAATQDYRDIADLLRKHGAQAYPVDRNLKPSRLWMTNSMQPSRWTFEE